MVRTGNVAAHAGHGLLAALVLVLPGHYSITRVSSPLALPHGHSTRPCHMATCLAAPHRSRLGWPWSSWKRARGLRPDRRQVRTQSTMAAHPPCYLLRALCDGRWHGCDDIRIDSGCPEVPRGSLGRSRSRMLSLSLSELPCAGRPRQGGSRAQPPDADWRRAPLPRARYGPDPSLPLPSLALSLSLSLSLLPNGCAPEPAVAVVVRLQPPLDNAGPGDALVCQRVRTPRGHRGD